MEEQDNTLDSRIRIVMKALTSSFIFRKLGICFDYKALPGEFPRKTLPTSRETRDGKPSDMCYGSGIYDCTRNNGILFDGYLTRIELGLDNADEERIVDRLVGGLIRIATNAPKGFLVRGLTPDGRGFPVYSGPDAHLYWALTVFRGYHTPALQPGSQSKMKNIASKWIAKVDREDYKLRDFNDKELCDLNEPENGAILLALLSVAANVTGESKWRAALKEKSTDRLTDEIINKATTPRELLDLQIALHMIDECCEDEELEKKVSTLMLQVAHKCKEHVVAFKELKDPMLDETPDLDWRTLEQSEGEFEYPLAWRRIPHEMSTVGASIQAAYAILLTGDKTLCEESAYAISQCLTIVPWDKLWFASTFTPAIAVHALGVEMELWDKEMLPEMFEPADRPAPVALVAPYLTEDFDENNPEKSGHTEPAIIPDKFAKYDEKEKPARKKRKRRRRRRPQRSSNNKS